MQDTAVRYIRIEEVGEFDDEQGTESLTFVVYECDDDGEDLERTSHKFYAEQPAYEFAARWAEKHGGCDYGD